MMHHKALRLKIVMIVLMVVLVGAAFTSVLAQSVYTSSPDVSEDRFASDIDGMNVGYVVARDAASGLPTGKR